LIDADAIADSLDIGGGVTRTANQFGAAWYSGDYSMGGSNVCTAGKCEFGRGMRVFFLLDYSGDGEGLAFSLLNGALNSTTSVGGDRDLPELMGYAGDSRLDSSGTSYLDGSGTGLRAPKMAMEFDTRPNSTNFTYCSGAAASSFNPGTRNDPLDSGRDAVQYVFWGFDTSLDIACRGNKVSYDDNRHDSGENLLKWASVSTLGIVRSTPAVGPDGTIYVGSMSGRLFAFNPDGSEKWRYPSSGVVGSVISSPVVGSNGVVYFGSDDGKVYGINASSGAQDYVSSNLVGSVRGSPVIGAGGKVYIGAENSKFYGFSPSLSKLWEFTMGGPISYGRPPVSASGIIYISHRDNTSGRLYAIDPAKRELATPPAFPATGEWQFNIIDGNERMAGIDPDTGMIYTNSGGTKIIALRPDGTQAWEFVFDADMDSSPVVGPDGTVYFGADNAILYAINPQDRNNGLTFPTAREWSAYADSGIDCTPAIASDGTIIVSSSSGNLYAFYPGYPDNTKWYRFLGVSSVSDGAGADARPNSSPAIGNNGTIYIGSSDNRLYALNNFAVPRNFKDKLVAGAADLNLGPWAVRMEVDRSQTANGSGNYEYTLHSWVRQCSQMDCRDELGTFFENTRVKYSARTPHIEQTVELNPTQHDNFTRLLFGFTGAVATGDDQRARIDKFQLSFIRFNDPEITTDPDWP
jgi:outer membrane protein assembly factor BamB